MNENINRSYKEVNEILNLMGDSYKDRVPKKMKTLFDKAEDKNYEPGITLDDFMAGKMLDETKTILTILYINYWADLNEKNQYMDKIRKIDEENKDKNKIVLNELFPEKVYKEIEPNEVEKQITDTKKSGISQIIMDILEKIKSIFNK